ncbi:putative nucleolar preribosomal associated cytoplasmic ATPase [Plasmodium gaboni]|uniref:GPN-loop GTPase 3 n=1 Tax=Plasmodium gaboni TaxID=647221 RepID=A0A151LEA5_9APIC|nr:putative nucleolar preribosomal associated cytoplasmic ATPase [Plasmodium gaboni]KYN97269.1 putative nucleolar preribosomal associated cytoplasmic ATPase [Plasmodium gaboni]
MKYGQVVVGPAGSGKSNYCKLMKEFMRIKKRNCYVVNLDSACEEYYYERKKKPINTTSNIEKELNDYYDTIYDIDIRNYVEVNNLMEEQQLGPNCALLRSVEILYENSYLLEDELNNYDDDDNYFIIDTPGQIELYTHTDYFKKILNIFTDQNIRLIIVFLIDISFISSNTKLLSAYLTSLSTMINFELPHINILNKCDLLISKNYYHEFNNFKHRNNFFYQKELYKKINKKLLYYKNQPTYEKDNSQENDHFNNKNKHILNHIKNNYHNLNITNQEQDKNNYHDDKTFLEEIEFFNNTKSFKDEYVLWSDVENTSLSSYSSFNSNQKNNNHSIYNSSDENKSVLSDECEETIYKKNYEKLNDILSLDPHDIIITANKCMSKKYYKLNNAFANIIEDFNLVSFLPLNIYDDDNVDFIINSIDMIIQYGEDKDVNDNYDMGS